MDESDHKHKFKFSYSEDYFLYKQLVFVCQRCFCMCVVDRAEFYSIITEVVDRDQKWR